MDPTQVKVLIERTALAQHEAAVLEQIRMLRGEALRQRGYTYGETWRGVDDPLKIVVVSVWGDREHWEAWERSEFRRRTEDRLASMLSGPATVREFQDASFGQ